MEITLKTANGEFVQRLTILPFQQYPEVIIWGSRVFNQSAAKDSEYWECFFYVIPPAPYFEASA